MIWFVAVQSVRFTRQRKERFFVMVVISRDVSKGYSQKRSQIRCFTTQLTVGILVNTYRDVSLTELPPASPLQRYRRDVQLRGPKYPHLNILVHFVISAMLIKYSILK